MPRTEQTTAAALQPGDRITELDTPEGPFYSVTAVHKTRLRMTDPANDEGDILIRFRDASRAAVLRLLPEEAHPADPADHAGCEPCGAESLAAALAEDEALRRAASGKAKPGDLYGPTEGDGYQPAEGRNLIAEKRARLDAPKRSRSRKSGDPRADRARGEAREAAAAAATPLESNGEPGKACGACGAAAGEDCSAPLQPLSAVAYPEALTGHALCWGDCGMIRPVSRFPFIANKGDGKGRMTECASCQTARLARNKEARAAGRETEPKPRAEALASV